jgi:hypothetical protein
MPVRKNVVSLAAAERAALVAAIKAMKGRPDPDGVAGNLYDKYVLQHSETMRTPSPPNTDPLVCNMAHRGPSFCPWHREFLRRFELDLGMPLPYWDWAADQASGTPKTAPVWGDDLMGPDGDPAADPATGRPADAVTSGPFAHDPSDSSSWSIVQDPAIAHDPTVPWLTRGFGRMQSTLPTPQDVAASMPVTPYDNAPWNVSSQGFRNFLEGFIGPGLHNAAHMWVGGSMMPSTSPNDPVFFLHHANVDRIWANWERQWFGSAQGDYLPTGGGPVGHNLMDGMFPWGTPSTPQSVLDTFALGYWYDDGPAPAVAGLAPDNGDVAGGTIVVISGSGFVAATAVSFGPNPAITFNVDTDRQITALSPPGSGIADVMVTTPVGTSVPGTEAQFGYVSAAPPPQVTAINPTTGSTAGGDVVTITGAGLADANGVEFGSTPATSLTVDSDTQITAVSPAGNSGTVDVTVTTTVGRSGASATDQFTYVVPMPAVTALSPSGGSAAGGDQVTITGTGFTGATGVAFGTVAAAAFTVDSDTRITATSPAGSGTVDVTVTTPAGTSATGTDDQFTYAVPLPAVTALSPSGGSAAGGDQVTITGTGFTGATGVDFGTVAAAAFTVDSDTRITATSPAGSGTVDVTVTTLAGTSATGTDDQFSYSAIQVQVTGVSPSMGSATGGDDVTITGRGFVGATEVNFGTSPALAFTVDSDTQITATSPAGTGTVDVVIMTPAGASPTSTADQFMYE